MRGMIAQSRLALVFGMVFGALAGFAGEAAAQSTLKAAPVTIEPAGLSFGNLLPGTTETRQFSIVNDSDQALRLVHMEPSCPCLNVSTESTLIPVGGSLPVTVELEGGWGPHEVSYKNIQLFFEDYEIATNTAVAFGVEWGVHIKVDGRGEKKIDLRRGKRGSVRLISGDDRPFSVLKVNGEAPEFPGGFDPLTMDPRKDYNVVYDFTDPAEVTPLYFIIETDHPDAQMMAIPVFGPEIDGRRHQWQQGRFVVTRRCVVLDEVQVNEKIPFTVDVRGFVKGTLKVEATPERPDLLWVDVLRKQPIRENEWRLECELTIMDPSFRGLLNETVVLNGGNGLQTAFQIAARVEDELIGARGDTDE